MQYVMILPLSWLGVTQLPFLDKPHDTFRLFVCAAVCMVRYSPLAKTMLGLGCLMWAAWDAWDAWVSWDA